MTPSLQPVESARQIVARIARQLRLRFEVDTRALAALRIALGLGIAVDLIHRAHALELFYTGRGVYPLSVHEATYGWRGTVSVYALSDTLLFQTALFLLAGCAAIAFALGYRTRLAGAISFLLLVSLHVRTPVVLNGGDRLLRVLLFIALLTPLGERYSIDSVRGGSARRTVVGVGTVVLLCQPIIVFTTNALQKRQGNYWYVGEGLEHALYDPTMATAFGAWLLNYPTLLTLLNYAWIALLAGSIPLLLLATGRVRTIVTLAYLGSFAGMALTLSVGLFPLVLSASVIPFLTVSFWNRVDRLSATDRVETSVTSVMAYVAAYRPRWSLSSRPRWTAVGTRHQPVLTALAVVVFVWMLAFAVTGAVGVDPPEPFDSDHLNQQEWGLYAPDPADASHWHVVVVEREDGSRGTVVGEHASVDRPPDAGTAYDTFRHRRFLMAVDRSARRDGVLAAHYAEWVCSQTTAVDTADIAAVAVYRVRQPKPVTGHHSELSRTRLYERVCR